MYVFIYKYIKLDKYGQLECVDFIGTGHFGVIYKGEISLSI